MISTIQAFKTDRLSIRSLAESDGAFIFELVNTEGWLTFIGNRNVSTENDALAYIQKINANKNITYWVVQSGKQKIGVITLIKRDHLPFHDIGFAFLPGFQGKGYALEATNAILERIIETTDYPTILAITMPNNLNSIRLIEKLGFFYDKTEGTGDELSSLYKLGLDKLKIDRVIKKFFSAFTNKGIKPKLNLIRETCMTQTIIIKNTNGLCESHDLKEFITPREVLLTNGELQDFEEYETDEKTVITRNIAQRFSWYQKEGVLNDEPFSAKGNKMFQMVKTGTQWKICNVIWDDE